MRKCGEQNADYTHIIWSCGIISEFWEKAVEQLSKIFNIQITRDPLTLLLGKIPTKHERK